MGGERCRRGEGPDAQAVGHQERLGSPPLADSCIPCRKFSQASSIPHHGQPGKSFPSLPVAGVICPPLWLWFIASIFCASHLPHSGGPCGTGNPPGGGLGRCTAPLSLHHHPPLPAGRRHPGGPGQTGCHCQTLLCDLAFNPPALPAPPSPGLQGLVRFLI